MHTRRQFFRRTTLAASVALAASSRLSSQVIVSPKGLKKKPAHPNLLFLWTDQHRADVMPYTAPALRAPALARLSERSFCFTRAYCTQPVCTPSRGSILTGFYPHRHGAVQNNIALPAKVKTFAEYASGYETAYYGKWHLGNELNPQHGFADWRSIEDEYRKYYSNPDDRRRFSDYHHFLLRKGFPPDLMQPETGPAIFSRTLAASLAEPYTKSAFLGQEAARFLQQRDRSRPFILSVNTLEPHSPTYGPLNELHRPDEVHTGPAFARPVAPDAARLHRHRHEVTQRDGYKNHPTASEHDWRRLRANYYGLVSMVDNAFGRVLRALEESGEADSTIIVYTSDHGDMCGDHCLMRKEVFYEGAVNIPLMIHVPWLSRGRAMIDAPFSQVDLAPTIMNLLGIGAGARTDGVSRADWFDAPGKIERAPIIVEWTDAVDRAFDGRSIISEDRLKLNLYHGDRPELYDLKSDPGELRNVATSSSHAGVAARLREQVRTWQQSAGDRLELATG